MNSDLTDSFFDLHRDLKLIPKKLMKLKECNLLSAQDYDNTITTMNTFRVSLNLSRTIENYSTLLMDIVRGIYAKARENTSRHTCAAELRSFRSWVSRSFLACFIEFDYPQGRLMGFFSNMDELSEIIIEWRHLGIDISVLLEELSLFLDFEDCVLNAVIEGEPTTILEKSTDCYAKFTEKSTFVSGFILISSMVDQFKLNALRRPVTEDLRRFESNIMLYHLSARMKIIDVFKMNINIIDRKVLSKSRLNDVQVLYDDGIKKSIQLWPIYLEMMDHLKQLTHGTVFGENVTVFWIKAKMSAQMAVQLSENGTLELLDELIPQTTYYESVLNTAVKQFPLCCEFRCRQLQFHISRYNNNLDVLLITFKDAIETLRNSSLDNLYRVFSLFINFLMFVHPGFCEDIFYVGLNFRKDLAGKLCLYYLKWSISFAGLRNARKMLEEDFMKRAPLEFFKYFLNAEACAFEPSAEAIRHCYDVALRYYGERDESLWEEYVNFELSKLGNPENVAAICNRAKAQYRSVDGTQVLLDLHRRSRLFRIYKQKL